MEGRIVIKGAREHNLKGIDLQIPRNRLVVITGVSGSGKSSLAFDTIYAEGQRRYIESLSLDARQFLTQLQRPDVDYIEGLSPAISIDQDLPSKSPRSTVGTITEIYDYLRLLFAKIGRPHCHKCGRPIKRYTLDEILSEIESLPKGEWIQILAPVERGDGEGVFLEIRKKGYVRVRIDGKVFDIDDLPILGKGDRIEILVDRVVIGKDSRRRIADSIETALGLGDGLVIVSTYDGDLPFSEDLMCVYCGTRYEEPSPRIFSFNSPYGACPVCKGIGFRMELGERCSGCGGARLRKESLSVLIKERSIYDISRLSIDEIRRFFNDLGLCGSDKEVTQPILEKIKKKLGFLIDVGLHYLSLDRASSSLSGGELQRIRLATQIGSDLVGIIYVLDEPSIGLHPRDIEALLKTLFKLVDGGNTLIVVEHDPSIIRSADYIIDLGPGAGERGGYVVATGSPHEVSMESRSLTGQYLSGKMRISVPKERKISNGRYIVIKGACRHNLKDIEVRIPVGLFTCVTGVSGSGKSTLVQETLYKIVNGYLRHRYIIKGLCKEVMGLDYIERVIVVNSSPIPRTSRSNPATYTGVFTHIRTLYASVQDSKIRGYDPERFSFNRPGGRCEACKGEGVIKVKMHFLPDAYVRCELCKGRRYNHETLEVRYRGKSIADVLDMTVDEAMRLFRNIPKIKRSLETLAEVGLGYIRLGQSGSTLSGGEIQRLKLSLELMRRSTSNTLYLLDEPTTGLHLDDVQRLLDILKRLRDAGNTVVVIEHNLDVIKNADYIIDLGPEGGDEGGRVVASGTPEEVALEKASYTGRFLREVLSGDKDF